MRLIWYVLMTLVIIYGGFWLVETGVTELTGVAGDGRALQVYWEAEAVHIVFAGELYSVHPGEIYSCIKDATEDLFSK